MKHLLSSKRNIATSVTESCWSIQFVNRDRICQVCLNLGQDRVTQVLLEGRILLLSRTAPVFCQDAGVMTKWLGNHLVSSNNKKERIAQLRNERTNTASTTVTFSSERQRKCCYQGDIRRDLGKRALLSRLVEIVLSSFEMFRRTFWKYSKEFLKKPYYLMTTKGKERSLADVLHYKSNSIILYKASVKCMDILMCNNSVSYWNTL